MNALILTLALLLLLTTAYQFGRRWALASVGDDELRKQSLGLRYEARSGRNLDELLPEAFSLVREAKMVLTDSGGIQEETTYLGIPCLTLRDTTERPVTVTEGSNRLVTPDNLDEMIAKVMAGDWPTGRKPDLWDGRTAGRIAADIKRRTPKK